MLMNEPSVVAGAVLDAVAAEVRDLAEAGLGHLLADEATTGGGDAAVEDRLGAASLNLVRIAVKSVVPFGAPSRPTTVPPSFSHSAANASAMPFP